MTPRSFFAVIIKIIGIYLLAGAIISIPQIISSLFYYRSTISDPSAQDIFGICFFVLFSISFFLFVLYYCLFKTEWIIDKLRLDQNFTEEKFDINLHRSTILKIAVIVIGAVMIVDSLPVLCQNLLTYFQTTSAHVSFKENRASSWLIFAFGKFCIGFSLISASRPIVNFIELKRKEPVIKTQDID